MKAIEYDLLESIVMFMEREGVGYKLVTFNIDHSQVNDIYDFLEREYTVEQLKKAADICLAHEWIENTCMSEKYDYLKITEKGIGVVRSRRKKIEILKSKTVFKRASDYIEDHKGVFVLLGFTIALMSLLFNVFKRG